MSWLLALALSAAPAVFGNDTLESVKLDGRPRVYHVHTPPPGKSKPFPAVLNFHGWGSNALEQIALSGLHALADKEGFVVLSPEGVGVKQSWNGGACCGEAVGKQLDDVAFVRELLDQAIPKYGIDPKRVFATGMSNGAFFSHRLACELPNRIAAIAPVAGVNGAPACAPSRPVSVLQFHGTDDPLVRYAGGGLATFHSVEETMADWARRDGCGKERERVLTQGDVTCERFKGCPKGVDVELCTVQGGGHTWPGGPPVPQMGKTSTALSATEVMWRFFQAHPRP